MTHREPRPHEQRAERLRERRAGAGVSETRRGSAGGGKRGDRAHRAHHSTKAKEGGIGNPDGFEATTSSLKGKRLVIFPNSLVRLFARQGAARLDALRAGGTTEGLRDRMLSFDELNALLGTAEVLESGRRYAGERDPG